MKEHKPDCISGNQGPEWSGSPNYEGNPDNEWICDECGAVIVATNEEQP